MKGLDWNGEHHPANQDNYKMELNTNKHVKIE
jgi:hypothetical protein